MFEQRDDNEGNSFKKWIRGAVITVTSLSLAGVVLLSQSNIGERETESNDAELASESSEDRELEVIAGSVTADDLDLLMNDSLNRAGDPSDFQDVEETTEETTTEETTEETTEATTSTTEATTEATTTEEATTTTEATTVTTTTTQAPTTTTTTTTQATTTANTVTAAKGDGWWHLGEKAGVDFRYLAVFNGKDWTDPVYTGRTYKVPTADELAEIELPVITTTTRATTRANNSSSNSTQAPTPTTQSQSGSVSSPKVYTLSQFMFRGRLTWQGKEFTFYSQRVLPGPGLRIPGRHVSADGYVVDGNGYIVLASDYYAKGTIISTPFGAPGKVYDAFGTGQGSHRFDVYIR